MTYEEALEYLSGLGKFGMNFGLRRIEKLMELLGNPERNFKVIHITGSNGKGSTTMMLASILTAGGLKTAMYTSPHLSEYTERMVIDGREIEKPEFAAVIDRVKVFVSEMVDCGWEHPTEFEVLTAAAFCYFSAQKVEFAVVEVGLGGLLDSTNVVGPEISVITNVSLEHQDRCGGTIAEIAAHKAGIIKQGAKVVTAATGAALDIIREKSHEKSSRLFVADVDYSATFVGYEGNRQILDFSMPEYGFAGRFIINLLGRHQIKNAAIAIATAVLLSQDHNCINLNALRAGLERARWPGRFEIMGANPKIVLDGAHNLDGAKVLRAALDDVFPGKAISFLLGILADKDMGGIAGTLVTDADTTVIVSPVSDRAATPETVANFLLGKKVFIAESIGTGLEKAIEIAGPNGVVCIAGSLYLIGPVRELVRAITK